jgi:hypothetical protein
MDDIGETDEPWPVGIPSRGGQPKEPDGAMVLPRTGVGRQGAPLVPRPH